MKRIFPRTIRPLANGMSQEGYFIQWENTETGEEKWQEISKEEWRALWGEKPTQRTLQQNFIALAARYGLYCDPPIRRNKPLFSK